MSEFDSDGPKRSGYVATDPYRNINNAEGIDPAYGAWLPMRNGRIVEPGDDALDDVADGYAEIRAMRRRGIPGY